MGNLIIVIRQTGYHIGVDRLRDISVSTIRVVLMLVVWIDGVCHVVRH